MTAYFAKNPSWEGQCEKNMSLFPFAFDGIDDSLAVDLTVVVDVTVVAVDIQDDVVNTAVDDVGVMVVRSVRFFDAVV